MLPYGNNIILTMKLDSKKIGQLVRATRKGLGVTQKELALSSGTGLRFIIELEQGKPTCQLEKSLNVVRTLGIKMEFIPPNAVKDRIND